jgi:hypothetical protein
MLSFFSERLSPIFYSEIKRFIKPIIGILLIYFSPASIMRFAYFKYLENRLNIKDILGAVTRGITFYNLRIKFSL